jgi:hypothetical protein
MTSTVITTEQYAQARALQQRISEVGWTRCGFANPFELYRRLASAISVYEAENGIVDPERDIDF